MIDYVIARVQECSSEMRKVKYLHRKMLLLAQLIRELQHMKPSQVLYSEDEIHNSCCCTGAGLTRCCGATILPSGIASLFANEEELKMHTGVESKDQMIRFLEELDEVGTTFVDGTEHRLGSFAGEDWARGVQPNAQTQEEVTGMPDPETMNQIRKHAKDKLKELEKTYCKEKQDNPKKKDKGNLFDWILTSLNVSCIDKGNNLFIFDWKWTEHKQINSETVKLTVLPWLYLGEAVSNFIDGQHAEDEDFYTKQTDAYNLGKRVDAICIKTMPRFVLHLTEYKAVLEKQKKQADDNQAKFLAFVVSWAMPTVYFLLQLIGSDWLNSTVGVNSTAVSGDRFIA